MPSRSRFSCGRGSSRNGGADPWGTGYLSGFGNLRNYELLVVDRELGSIAPGKLADLVVIQSDPIRAPGEIYRVVTVFKGGAGYDSGRLRAAARGKVGVE